MINKGRISLVFFSIILGAASLGNARNKYDSIIPESTSIQVILAPSSDTIAMSDTLTIKAIIQNKRGFNLILAWRWDDVNLSLSWTDENGKDVGYIGDEHGPHLFLVGNSWPSSLILGWEHFWGFNPIYAGHAFPKPGTYYLQMTYWGTSPEVIKQLIEDRRIKRSAIDAPINKYWHGEVKSNKVKVVVTK